MVKDQPDTSGYGARTMFILGMMSTADSEPRREQVVLAPPPRPHSVNAAVIVVGLMSALPRARQLARPHVADGRFFNDFFPLFFVKVWLLYFIDGG